MAVNRPYDELRRALDEFVAYRQEHLRGDEKGEAQVFLDRLFRALGHGGVREAGATLEMRVKKRDNGGTAFADLLWKPRVLIEMKKAGEPLARHYRQAFDYWIDCVPNRPAYVVLSNFDEFWVYDLNKQLDEPVDMVQLAQLPLRWEALSFLLPAPVEPVFQFDLVKVTREAAARAAGVCNRLTDRGIPVETAQALLLQSLMAMFAEDIGLLPQHLFLRAVEDCLEEGESAYDLLFGLFRAMNTPGVTPAGRYKGTPYFNGGLFRDIEPIELLKPELEELRAIASFDWSAVRPAIFGTLFEQSLGQDERHAYGAHFTSEVDIHKVVQPSIVRPWREKIAAASSVGDLSKLHDEMLQYRVLDPACGCGNFLYVAYRELRRIEQEIVSETARRRRTATGRDQLGLGLVSPRQFFGIDIKPLAVEIAKLTLMLGRKLAADEHEDDQRVLPLDDLTDNFAAADALFMDWPRFNVCIGNPPYLGRRRLTQERGALYVDALDERYPEVGGVTDYVAYWFRRAHDSAPEGGRIGFVATNTVRQGSTREASLGYVVDNGGHIYEAVSSQPWSGDAVVDVSIVNWAKGTDVTPKTLWIENGAAKQDVEVIPPSLSVRPDLRSARRLSVNYHPKRFFQGQTPGDTAAFVLTPEEAKEVSADGRSAEDLYPYLLGQELMHKGRPGRFVIDIADTDPIRAENVAPLAFKRLRQMALPERQANAAKEAAANAEVLQRNPNAKLNWHHRNFLATWWQLKYRRTDMLAALEPLRRYVAISRVAKWERGPVFTFVCSNVRPSDAVQVFAFDDDYSFGILQSSMHRQWFEETCSTMRVDPRYTSSTVFETFPWPQAPTTETVEAVVNGAADLIGYREERLQEGVSLAKQYESLQFPGRNTLRDLHSRLDHAVMAAYGCTSQNDALPLLLALNHSVSDAEHNGQPVRGPGNSGIAGTVRSTYCLY